MFCLKKYLTKKKQADHDKSWKIWRSEWVGNWAPLYLEHRSRRKNSSEFVGTNILLHDGSSLKVAPSFFYLWQQAFWNKPYKKGLLCPQTSLNVCKSIQEWMQRYMQVWMLVTVLQKKLFISNIFFSLTYSSNIWTSPPSHNLHFNKLAKV